MNYGFLIRNDRCIGCHACSTACKSENEVPLGVHRTWVRSVETGAYPNVRRHFQVTRCNHCSNPPCVRICPVTAMYQREDGIVEFDSDACIGCKACLQACPYDAIYVDPDSGTASKCHYCAHRVELNLEPACVVVCPEHAIVAGDMDDPLSEISRMLAANEVTVRKPEQGTAPKLFYVDGNESNLTPTATGGQATYAWADSMTDASANRVPDTNSHQGLPSGGPVMIGGGVMADHMVQTAYNVHHKMPWHWPVPAYLVTKAVAAGAMLIMAFHLLFGSGSEGGTLSIAAGALGVIFTGITTLLLVFDLERPERFLKILLRPQWKSWLTRGAVILILFALLCTCWVFYAVVVAQGSVSKQSALTLTMLALSIPLAVGTASYTAFLFGQAEGRDLWQSALLPIHLIIQAVMAGAAALLILHLFFPMTPETATVLKWTLAVSVLVDLIVTLMGEFVMPHASETAARAARMISHGRYARTFWWGSIVAGHLLPLLLIAWGTGIAFAAASLLVCAGLYAYEFAFVMAPQRIPNS